MCLNTIFVRFSIYFYLAKHAYKALKSSNKPTAGVQVQVPCFIVKDCATIFVGPVLHLSNVILSKS